MPLLALLSVLYDAAERGWSAALQLTTTPSAGDVPGWVLVTVMTAALVVALMAVAGPKLTSAFNRAISSVNG